MGSDGRAGGAGGKTHAGAATENAAHLHHPGAASIAWQAPTGAGGRITFDRDGWPRIEMAPAAGENIASDAFRVAVSFSQNGTAPAAPVGPSSRAADLYLDLMKKCLTRIVFQESGPPIDPQYSVFDPAIRAEGRDWPADAESMTGLRRLDNVQQCVIDVLRNGVPGDLIETGVWRGGTTIFMRAILEAYSDPDRCVWVADSFQGLPKPDVTRYPEDQGWDLSGYRQLAVSLEQVQENFARYGLLDDRVRFLKGWFKDTLPTAQIDQLAVMRLDGDLYESTMDALTALYPKLSVGGYAIIDDYTNIDACRKAVDDYRAMHGITEPIHTIDWAGVYWRREGANDHPHVLFSSDQSHQPKPGPSEAESTLWQDQANENTTGENELISRFHRLYYDAARETWWNTYWFGAGVQKCPLDLWVYQEIIHETRPDLIIETGSMHGGSALYMASLLDLIGSGEIVSVDIEEKPWRPAHSRVTYLTGSSTAPDIVRQLAGRAKDKRSVMVILDSDHSQTHVAEELRLLSPLVTSGNYLIVEDTNVNGHPVLPEHGPGPGEALNAFLAVNDQFSVDRSREKFLLSFNPGGYLRRR
jgi:cephalosporin hydroxylase